MTAPVSRETIHAKGGMFRFPVRIVTARPRLFLCGLAGVAVGLATPAAWPLVVRALLGWDAEAYRLKLAAERQP